jgi:small multidrug resistance family-3 protein
MTSLKTILVFILAGFFEIGGGYLVWIWLKTGKPLWYGLLGMVILALYGLVATIQPSNFGRVYAAYGGVFVVMSLLWSYKIDHIVPDKFDIIGASVILLGAWIIFYAPRN